MNRNGAVLIEALVAVAILGAVGLSSIEYVVSLQQAQARLLDREDQMRRAERLLTATLLLSRSELEQRLGVRRSDDFFVWTDRPEPLLFRVGVSHADRPDAELLATLVYRATAEPTASEDGTR